MYLKKLTYVNAGPIKKLQIELPFDHERNPKPVLLVGENGSGKSLVLSNVVDAFYEMAGFAYQDALVLGKDGNMKYYKIIQSMQISVGQPYLCSYIEFEEGTDKIEYIFKSGDKAFQKFCSEHDVEISADISWERTGAGTTGNHKKCRNLYTTLHNRR